MKKNINYMKYYFYFERSNYWDFLSIFREINLSEDLGEIFKEKTRDNGLTVNLIITKHDLQNYDGDLTFSATSKGPTNKTLFERISFYSSPNVEFIVLDPTFTERLEHCLTDIQHQLFNEGLLRGHLRISHPYEWDLENFSLENFDYDKIENGNADYILSLPREKKCFEFTIEIECVL